MARWSSGARLLLFVFLFTLVFSVAELFAGIAARSLLLVEESVHMFADSISFGISLWAELHSEKGSQRANLIGASISVLTLTVTMVAVLAESIRRLAHLHDHGVVVNSTVMLVFGSVLCCFHLLCLGLYFSGFSVHSHGHGHHTERESANVVVDDVLTQGEAQPLSGDGDEDEDDGNEDDNGGDDEALRGGSAHSQHVDIELSNISLADDSSCHVESHRHDSGHSHSHSHSHGHSHGGHSPTNGHANGHGHGSWSEEDAPKPCHHNHEHDHGHGHGHGAPDECMHGHSHDCCGIDHSSLNMASAVFHIFIDFLHSLSVVATALIVRSLPPGSALSGTIDAIASLLLACVIGGGVYVLASQLWHRVRQMGYNPATQPLADDGPLSPPPTPALSEALPSPPPLGGLPSIEALAVT